MMMTLLIAAGLAGAGAPDPAVLTQPRLNYTVCLRILLNKSAEAKMPAGEFETALAGACAAEAKRYHKAMVDYDVASGVKLTAAEATAKAEIDDARATALDRYRRQVGGSH